MPSATRHSSNTPCGRGRERLPLRHHLHPLGQRATRALPRRQCGPAREIVTFGYNAVGQLASVTSDDGTPYVGQHGLRCAGPGDRAAARCPGPTASRASLPTTPARCGWTRSRRAKATPFEELQRLSYTYDLAGNVQTLTDATNSSLVQTFGYDWLDRLTSAATTTIGISQYSHTYAYNAIGNRRATTATRTPTAASRGHQRLRQQLRLRHPGRQPDQPHHRRVNVHPDLRLRQQAGGRGDGNISAALCMMPRPAGQGHGRRDDRLRL